MSYRKLYKKFPLPLLLAVFCLAVEFAFPHITLAQTYIVNYTPAAQLRFPSAADKMARYVIKVPITAYSSTPDQTDSTPFTTANGTEVHTGVVAANFLPFGTRIRIPQHFGKQIFIVEDRMNERYDVQLDIWMETREAARQWGIRYEEIEVL